MQVVYFNVLNNFLNVKYEDNIVLLLFIMAY